MIIFIIQGKYIQIILSLLSSASHLVKYDAATTLVTLTTYGVNNNIDINNDCLLNTLESEWYIDVRVDGVLILLYEFFNGVGYSNPSLSVPTQNDWVDALNTGLVGLLDYGLDYLINETDQTITIYNNNCLPLNVTQNFELNVGINFDILCNP
jgi:hypothetical protein